MPSLSGPPKLPTSNDPLKVYNVGFFSGSRPVPMGGGGVDYAAGSIASSADIAAWKKRREEMIARGEDPDALVKAREAKRQERKDKIKGFFGIKEKESDEQKLVDNAEGSDLNVEDGPDKVYTRSGLGRIARSFGK